MRYQFTPADAARFWAKVDRSGPAQAHCPELGPCWIWAAAGNGKGYGTFSVVKADGRWGNEYAHRVSFEAAYGALGPGECALHRCDNRGCVRPEHLFRGTKADNNRDMTAKGRNVMQTAPERAAAGLRRYYRAHPGLHAGERNPRARLTAQDIPAIRRRYAAEHLRLTDLATEYGVTLQSIWAVVKRRTWAHVA